MGIAGSDHLLLCPDAEGVARATLELLCEVVERKPGAVVALPTGRTPLRLYELLVARLQAGDSRFSRVEWFALDEFCGSLPRSATFRAFLEERLFRPGGLDPARLHSLDGADADPLAEAARYEQRILALGGLDLALLGIGGNGHIAFNEPGTPLASRTGLRPLVPATVAANRYLFPEGVEPPTHGLSLGIGTIVSARLVVLMATGNGKADAVGRLWREQPHPDLPATAIKLAADWKLVVDGEAARWLMGDG